jgi:hypothetical protein
MFEAVSKALEQQSRACATLGAPFSARLLDHARIDVERGGVVARLLAEWSDVSVEQQARDAVALRLLASLHYLALSGRVPELSACYPPAGNDPDIAWAIARQALGAQAELVRQMLQHEPQTNEVRRSACLLGGFLTIARDTGLPLRCFELGASAGLNSLWNRFRYEIGAASWGDPDSPVVLSCRWDGNAPRLDMAVTVIERQACDRRPIDIRRNEEAMRLMSYCWAEQQERAERLQAAILLARQEPVDVCAEQAARWIGRAQPQNGAATVVFHSVVWQYIPTEEQSAILATMKGHADRATADAPFFWLKMDFNEAKRRFELNLWQDGQDRLLAIVHPHGEFALWQ